MAADQQINITANQYASLSVSLTWVSGGAPINTSVYTGKMQVRDDGMNDRPVVAELTTENGCITMGGSNGIVTLTMTGAQTALIAARAYVYDLLMINGSEVHRMAEGSFTVSRGVTTLG